ncbi:MAG: hypothetical protein ACE37J_12270 [Pikeienuella sp.]|uniref:hypothetical protein n=1 Tax=Pikeienuella sp. TaxID=2831957 RepID=UPI00391AA873
MTTSKPNGSAADPFARFALPLELREGVEIPLPGTPAVFMVAPLSAYNDDFQTALMSKLPFEMSMTEPDAATLDAHVKPMEFVKMQREAFVETCIVSHRGLPAGMEPPAFFEAYPFALNLLFAKAKEVSELFDARMKEMMGNSDGSSSSTTNGPDEKTNMRSSQPRGSSRRKGGARKPVH